MSILVAGDTNVPHFMGKHTVERMIEGSKPPATGASARGHAGAPFPNLSMLSEPFTFSGSTPSILQRL